MDWSSGAIVVGGGWCVEGDLKYLEHRIGDWPGLVIVANEIGVWLDRHIDHWVTLHPENMLNRHRSRQKDQPWRTAWLQHRLERGGNRPTLWCHEKLRQWVGPGRMDRAIPQWGTGSSGLLGVAVAHEVCAGPVVLCGVPMTNSPHFPESEMHGGQWTQFQIHRKVWAGLADRLRERTTSMSGWTRELLGSPFDE